MRASTPGKGPRELRPNADSRLDSGETRDARVAARAHKRPPRATPKVAQPQLVQNLIESSERAPRAAVADDDADSSTAKVLTG